MLANQLSKHLLASYLSNRGQNCKARQHTATEATVTKPDLIYSETPQLASGVDKNALNEGLQACVLL